MDPFRALALLAVVFATPTKWEVRMARVEGAAASLANSAGVFATTAEQIEQDGRLTALSKLHGDGVVLQRNVIALRLALEYAAEATDAEVRE